MTQSTLTRLVKPALRGCPLACATAPNHRGDRQCQPPAFTDPKHQRKKLYAASTHRRHSVGKLLMDALVEVRTCPIRVAGSWLAVALMSGQRFVINAVSGRE